MPLLKSCKLLCSAAVLSLLFSQTSFAETTWTEVTGPHFRVLTDGSAQQGRDVVAEFEQMRHVFALQFNDQAIGSGAPLTIIAAHDADTFKTLEPTAWKSSKGNIGGEFHRGWEKQFATVILTANPESQVIVFHEYTHSILMARAHWLPIWLNEGFAEFYGYTRFEHNRTLVGTPSQRMATLRQDNLIPVTEMLDTHNETLLIRDARKANLFYAEAWAMVHYMMFGQNMESGARLNRFFQKLQGGEQEKTAFKEVFGDTRAFDEALSLYVRSFLFKAGVMPADEKIDPKAFPVRRLSPAETKYELGSFQIGAHEVKLGREQIENALALDPKLAGAHEELAFLEFRQGKDAEARKEWQQAVDLDPNRPRSAFALIMTGAPVQAQTVQQSLATLDSLQHVIDLSPAFAPAYIERALIEWHLSQMQRAYQDVRKAEQLEPWRAGYHILGGRILLAGHQPAQAAIAARFVAERWSGPDHNEAVDLWDEIPAKDRGDSTNFAMEIPEGAKVERGTLTELTCGSGPGIPMTLTLTPDAPGAAPLTFKSDGRFTVGFSDSFWWGEDHFTTCHHLAGHPAVVAYKSDDHHILDLEVRDDLPRVIRSNGTAAASTP